MLPPSGERSRGLFGARGGLSALRGVGASPPQGFRNGSSTTQRLDGAIYAASNAALMLVQLGDDPRALREVEAVRRRAPNSADMRAALAALYWAAGERDKAEDVWEYACGVLLEGCARYRDEEYLRRVRRWPPAMVDKMRAFLAVEGAAVARV